MYSLLFLVPGLSVQEVSSCAITFRAIAHFLFYLVQCIWFFLLRSLIHLELGFVQGDKYGFICILLHKATQFGQHHLLEMLSSFPQCSFLASLSK